MSPVTTFREYDIGVDLCGNGVTGMSQAIAGKHYVRLSLETENESRHGLTRADGAFI